LTLKREKEFKNFTQKFLFTNFIKDMITRINSYQSPYTISNRTSFGTNSRIYRIPSKQEECVDNLMETTSWMFRGDISWAGFVKYIESHFKNTPKVNIIDFACSDGSEAYSTIILLKENLVNADKFLPIKAYDIDDEIISAAKSGLINTGTLDRMNIQMYTDIPEKYLIESAKSLSIKKDNPMQKTKTYEITDELKDSVIFKKGDMYEVLDNYKDKSNTILMCRNVLGHLSNEDIEKFVKLASKKLKEDSIFVIGDHDYNNTPIDYILSQYNFSEVQHNIYIKNKN